MAIQVRILPPTAPKTEVSREGREEGHGAHGLPRMTVALEAEACYHECRSISADDRIKRPIQPGRID